MSKLITTNIVGSANDSVWSQAQSTLHDDNSQTLVVLRLRSDDPDSLIDLATVGAEMIAGMEGVGSRNDLKQEVETILGESRDGLEVDVVVGRMKDNEITFYGRGSIEVYLARDSKLGLLQTNWNNGEILKGVLKEEDVLLITTLDLVRQIGMEKFKTIITEDENPAEALTPLIHKNDNPTGMACLVGIVQTSDLPVEESVPPWWTSMIKRGPKITSNSREPRRINFWVGVVVFILLVIMIGVGMIRRVTQVEAAKYETLNTSIDAKISETVSVGDLNPERAKILLSQAKSEVEIYLASEARDEYKEKARKLLLDVEIAEEKAFKKNEVKLNTIVELSILSEGMTATQMKSDGKGSLIFLDSSNPYVISMNLSDRSRQVFDNGDSPQFVDVGVSESKMHGLDSQGVYEILWKTDTVKKVIEPDEFWKDPTYIEQFAGNMYVFDREQSEIWKYPVLTDSFGARRRWLAAGITPDLSKVVDMKVVGDIWLLTETGKLERYSRGAPVSFSLEGFPAKEDEKRFVSPKAVWVTDSLIYILESGAERIVVFDDDGKYKSQYANSEFGKARDLVIVDDKGYVLIDNVVKEFGL